MSSTSGTEAFIEHWRGVTASELSTAQSFVRELCDLLEVPKPHPTPEQDYMFERPVEFQHGDGATSAGRIDCYKRGHFVLEAKKVKAGAHTKGFDDALMPGETDTRATTAPITLVKLPWPTTLPEQIKAIAQLLAAQPTPLGVDDIAAHFTSRGRWRDRLPTILETLQALGRAREARPGLWIGSGFDRFPGRSLGHDRRALHGVDSRAAGGCCK